MQRRPAAPKRGHPLATGVSKPPVGVASLLARAKAEFQSKAISTVTKPVTVPPVKASTVPRAQVAHVVAHQIPKMLGLSSSSLATRTLQGAVTAAVLKVVPKEVTASQAKAIMAKVEGPPPREVPVLVPIGTLSQALQGVPSPQVSAETALHKVGAVKLVSVLVTLSQSCYVSAGGLRFTSSRPLRLFASLRRSVRGVRALSSI